jgi:hypothetical protein
MGSFVEIGNSALNRIAYGDYFLTIANSRSDRILKPIEDVIKIMNLSVEGERPTLLNRFS